MKSKKKYPRHTWTESDDHKVIEWLVGHRVTTSYITPWTVVQLARQLGLRKEVVAIRAKNIQHHLGGGWAFPLYGKPEWAIKRTGKIAKHISTYFYSGK